MKKFPPSPRGWFFAAFRPRAAFPAIALAWLASAPLPAAGTTSDPSKLGIGVYPSAAEMGWHTGAMAPSQKPAEEDRIESGPDLFEAEYGKPCRFDDDFLAQYGWSSGAASYAVADGCLAVTTGPKGFAFGFGPNQDHAGLASIRIGAPWAKNRKDILRLEMVIDQDADETEWNFRYDSPIKTDRDGQVHPFTVKGRGRQTVRVDVAFVRDGMSLFKFATGFRMECETPGASFRIESIRLAPSSANIYFRKTFTLPDKPILARVTYNDFDTYDLYVNGQLVHSGNRLYPSGAVQTVDLAPYLKQGANTIAYRKEFLTWNGVWDSSFLFEGGAVSRDGIVTPLRGDASWKWSYQAPDNWADPGFNDAAWKSPLLIDHPTNGINAPQVTDLADGTFVGSGIEPAPSGLLDVAPEGRKYPLFDFTETAAFHVRLPAGAAGKYHVTAALYKAGTDQRVEQVAVDGFQPEGDFAGARAAFATHEVGPYRVMWTVDDAEGKTVETERGELLVLGPIPQDSVPLASFEDNLEKRLERVIHIDCAATPAPGDFLDHSGMYHPPQLDKGQVTVIDGVPCRETGPDTYDYFCYRIHGLERGEPYLVEVKVPDDRERAVYTGVMEIHPVHYFRNGPTFGHFAATGAARLGGRYPLTHRLRTIRYVYYPSTDLAGVVVLNSLAGSRAAASEINVYRIRGGLPALQVPASDRLLGYHQERMTVAQVTLGSENPSEDDALLTANPHRDVWFHWYKILERKIELMRFQGQNMTVEGLYQYTDPFYPKARNSWISNDGIDLPLLAIKMYRYNGIRVYLGVEYVYDPALTVDGVDTVSDRRMQLGEGDPAVESVDRYGRQVGKGIWGGGNFLHPAARGYFEGMIDEIYDRYRDAGPVEGLYLISGAWWSPGFGVGTYRALDDSEVGYDDTTVALFAKETGVTVPGEGTDPNRFAARYDFLMGPQREAWLAWRTHKLRESFRAVSAIVQKGAAKWKVMVAPAAKMTNAFADPQATPEQRDDAYAAMLRQADLPPELYAQESSPGVGLLPGLTPPDWEVRSDAGPDALADAGLVASPGTARVVEQLGAVSIDRALDEIDCPTVGAPSQWIWTTGTRGVFIQRGIEDNAFHDYATLLRGFTPRVIVDSWLDCNMETAFGPQERRFAKAFYATPSGVAFAPLSSVTGAAAQSAAQDGLLYLRLVNAAPYPVHGTIRVQGGAESANDLVYDRPLTPGGSPGEYALDLAPNDIRIVALKGAAPGGVSGGFAFEQDIAEGILAQGRDFLGGPAAAALASDLRAQFQDALDQGDAVAVEQLLESWDVVSALRKAKAAVAAHPH